METNSRQVDELQPQERTTVELLTGRRLRKAERLNLQIVDVDVVQPPTRDTRADELLPAWCHVYKGLPDQAVRTINESIIRCNLTRSFE
jgi:hypothetical protein